MVQNRLHGMRHDLDLSQLQLDSVAHNAQLRMSAAQANWSHAEFGMRFTLLDHVPFRHSNRFDPSPPFITADVAKIVDVTRKRALVATVSSLRYQAGACVLNCARTSV